MKKFRELLGWDSLFRMFEVGSKVIFFSCGSAGYMFAHNYAYDSHRRRVLAWTNGYQRGVDEWTLIKEGSMENTFYIKSRFVTFLSILFTRLCESTASMLL